MQHKHLIRLREILATRFSLEDLRDLCFYLKVEFDDIRGDERRSKSLALLEYLKQKERIADLVAAGQMLRPDVAWGEEDAVITLPKSSLHPEGSRFIKEYVTDHQMPRLQTEIEHPPGDTDEPSVPADIDAPPGRDNGPFGRQQPPPASTLPSQPIPPAAQPLDPTLFTRLSQLIATQQWQEADRETMSILLRVSARKQGGFLLARQIRTLPCEALLRTDSLWSKASKGRFGFSAQLRVWREVAGSQSQFDLGNFQAFGERTGWRIDGKWRRYNQFLFTEEAPTAHLPTLRVRANESSSRWWNEWMDNLKEFFDLFRRCLPQE